ncbi:putative disease resistance RPP13-like protein 1 [Abeliophyllum distichum]|uniref:Disease resistance RPP13-like protein 1 n=1 Tax=Abeliophyllum distichum TaxID=126358 RepID=A0ABD1Q2T8_9LAMI
MVDATINMVVKRLAPIIEQRVRDEVNLLLNSRNEAASLASKLKRIQQLLEAAERKGVTDPQVKAWLEKIEDVAYEMDDVLDEWEMRIHEHETEGSEDVSDFWEKVSSFIQSLCLCFQDVIKRRRIALKIKQLNGRLESIAKENDDEFKFLPNLSEEIDQESQRFNRVLATSFVDESKIKGRVDDKNILLSKLLSESEKGNGIQIISIVGTGGLGKTTLAQLVFNDFRVKTHFEQSIWICVSNPFNEIRIAKAILESLNQTSPNLTEFQTLLQCIETTVSGKRFLLVLDDVWEHDEHKWKPLKICLSKGAPDSRILVTTRNRSVAKMMGTVNNHLLRPLSDSECFVVLSQKAFEENKENHNTLEPIGRKIAKKCNGLPLAAETLGSLLQFKDTVQEWNNVLNSEIWQLEVAEVDIFPHLYLSYNELRPAVKRCFSYCAIFPKDSKIKVDTLIRMWMAQGFLSGESAAKMELKGQEYVKDLATRSFFQGITVGDLTRQVLSCKMHDIIHDFAPFLTKSELFSVDITDDIGITAKEASCPNARHLNWKDHGMASSPVLICSVEKLRSFLCENYLPPHVLSTLKCVRLLNLSHCELRELPPEMGNLIHLRYLDLSYNYIREFPRTLCGLYYLQTLNLLGCEDLTTLPAEINKLINLRHLLVSVFSDAVYFLQGLEKLTGLRTLKYFKAGRGRNNLGCLQNLNQLEGELLIFVDNLNEESDAVEAQKAALTNKNSLTALHLQFTGEVSMDVMVALQPPPNLLKLKLEGYVGIEFHRWITMSLNNLKVVEIYRCSSLPPLGNLQFLERLHIGSIENMTYLGREFLGITGDGRAIAFPKLKRFDIFACEEWTEWEDIREEEEDVVSIMPCLMILRVSLCPNLKALPHRLLSRTPLKKLYITNSHLIIEQYNSRGGYEFLSPTCRVIVD